MSFSKAIGIDLSESKDVKSFYTNLFVTHEVFNIVNESNIRIFKEEREKRMPQKELSADIEYILSFTKKRKDLFLLIVDKMYEYDFASIPSLNKTNFSAFGGDSARYYILEKHIFLFEHTINVVIQMIDMLSESEHAESTIEIGMFLAFFHDFGKCPQIQLMDTEDRDQSHEKISANYAKHFLTKYSLENPKNKVSEEIIKLIFDSLYAHHTPSIEKGVFLKMLIEADTKARDFELRMVKTRRSEDGKI